MQAVALNDEKASRTPKIKQAKQAKPPPPHGNHIVCTYCAWSSVMDSGPQRELRKCANCQLSQYCSRQCQKDDWPLHKQRCLTLAPRFHEVMKLLKHVTGSEDLTSKLSIAVALHFMEKWIEKPDASKMWFASIPVAFEPYDLIAAFTHAATGDLDKWLQGSVQGVLTFFAARDHTDNDNSRFISQWQSSREQSDRSGCPDMPVVIFSLTYQGTAIFTGPLPISKIEYERAKIIFRAKQRYPGWWSQANPMLEILNYQIKEDVPNSLKLRTKMTDIDKRAFAERFH